MKSFSIIDTIVKEFEEDADLMRIKKVIYYACENKWEDNETKLKKINLKELIGDLYNKIENKETLDKILYGIVSKVNKKTEYSLLAQKIIDSMGKLYPQEEEMTVMEYSLSWSLAGSHEQTVLKEKLVVKESYPRDPGKLFDVREKIIQATNPLKAKIIIFSTVEHQFYFSDRDWLLLKTKNLDNLLRQIFNLCPSITELEFSLYSAANNFEDPDEYTQVANIIIKALTPCYSEEIITPQSQAEAEKSEALTPDTQKTNMECDGYSEKGDISLLERKELASTNYQDEISFLEDKSIVSYENITNYTEKNIYESTSETEEENFGDSSTDNQQMLYDTPAEAKIVTLEPDEEASMEGKNILDSIKQKLRFEDEIYTVIKQKTDVVMNVIEVEFMSLEKTLNNLLQWEPEEKRLSLKYRALGDLISNIQQKHTKYKEILRQLEIEERKKLNLNNSGNTINKELERQKETYDENQQKIIELATQGNPKAVAMIINRLLEKQGIKVIAARKNDYIHIVLESELVPNPEIVIPVVEKKIASLQSEYLKNIKIHGMQLGSKSIIWTKTILL